LKPGVDSGGRPIYRRGTQNYFRNPEGRRKLFGHGGEREVKA